MAGEPVRLELERAHQLESIRIRGVRGSVIQPHRSMVGLPWTAQRLLSTLTLTGAGLALLYVALPWLGVAWQRMFEVAREFLGWSAPLTAQHWRLLGGIEFSIPGFAVLTPEPGREALVTAGIASAVVLVLSLLLPARFTPLRYFLRLLVLIQASAIAFFAWSPEVFPYRLQDHLTILFTAGLVVMGLVPVVLGLTLHVFDLALWKKALLTVLVLGHLAVFIPLQVLVQLWLVLHGTALVMPVLFLVFGLLLDVLIFVAFYGWALSWRGELERREIPPPAHLARAARGRRE
jgi:hypothetical protein